MNQLKSVEEKMAEAREIVENSKSLELDDDALTVAHLAIEDTLVMMRDSRMAVMGYGNGFVIKEKSGSDSSIMRLGTRSGLEIAIKAYVAALDAKKETV